MADLGLGGYKSIDSFVEAKLGAFGRMEKTFSTFFELMFREAENVMYERSMGYRVKKTTYGEAKAHIAARTAALRRRLGGIGNVGADSVVGLYMDNSLEWIECFWAILCAGCRPLLMNMRLPLPALEDALGTLGALAVVGTGAEFSVPVISPDELLTESGSDGESAMNGESTSDGDPATGGFGTEVLVMSSGTSEHVKLCAYGAEEFYYQIMGSFYILKECPVIKTHYDGSLKLLAFLPFYHVFGLIAMYVWFAFFSRTFVHLENMAPQTIVNTIKRHKVTHIFAVPLFWEKTYEQAMKTIRSRGEKTVEKFERGLRIWRKLPDGAARLFSRLAFREVRENMFGDSIVFLITGGSAIRAEVLEFFNAIGYRLANGYGMTEIGITSVELSPKRKYLCGGFVGKALTNAEYSLNEDGELIVGGRVIAKYVIEDGVRRDRPERFNTRDLAEEVDGHWRILGRRDELIVGPSGENVNPNLVEPLLLAKGARGVCLTADGAGKTVLLVSVDRFTSEEKYKEIDGETKALIADASLSAEIGGIVYISEPLMREDEFKLNRLRLARELASGALARFDTSFSDEGELDALESEVRRYFAVTLDREDDRIAADADFFVDLGGTSLDYLAMIARLGEEFGVSFPEEAGKGLNTVREIASFIRRSKE